MTIAVGQTGTYVQLPCNGVTTSFNFPNKIFAAGDLVVTLIDPSGNQYPFANQANVGLGLNYVVNNVDVDLGCSITMNNPPTNLWTIDIRSVVPEQQTTSIKNQGAYLPELHEEFFDRSTRMLQDLYRRSYQFGIHGPDIESAPWTALPGAAVRKGQFLAFDTSANALPTVATAPITQTLATQQVPFYGVDSGAANAYVVSSVGTVAAALTVGALLRFTAINGNTGASVLNWAGLGNQPIVGQTGLALTGGEILSTGPTWVQWTGSAWQIVGTGAQPANVRTPAEIAASVTPVNYGFAPGVIDRYGTNTTPGTTDMATAIQNAVNSNVNVYGLEGSIYKYASNIALPRDMVLDLRGAKLQPSTSAQFFNNPSSPDVTTNVTNALKGSLFISVASSAGLAVGNIIALQPASPPNGPVPFFWAQIKQIVANVLTLDRPLPIDYISNTNSTGTLAWQINTVYKYADFVTNGGNVYFCAIGGTSAGAGGPGGTTPNTSIADNTVVWVYWGPISCNLYNNATTLRQRCIIRNGDVDGTFFTLPGSLGMFLRASLYRNVLLENLRFYNWNTTAGVNQPDMIGIFYGIDCKIARCTFDENVMNASSANGSFIDVQGFRTFTLENNTIMGSGFGCDGTACENFIVTGNSLNGTATYEQYSGLAAFPLPLSARGVKGTRCASVIFSGNVSVNYSTPLRTDQGIRAQWIGNTIRNADASSVLTFTANVAGTTSGTLTVAVPNATYTGTFSDGEVRSVTITGGTAAAWSGALSAGTITTVWLQGAYPNSTAFAMNGSSTYCPIQRGYVIEGNIIENCGGYAIAFHSGVGIFSGRNICRGNKIIGCNAAGIYSTDSDAIIEGNHIENWDRSGGGYGAIHLTAASHTIRGNRFRHDTDATRWCISTLPTSGATVANYVVDGNTIEGNTANPMIQGGYDVRKVQGTTLSTATQTQTFAPNLVGPTFVVDASMAVVNPTTKTPTNSPRMVSVTAAGANTVSVSVDGDPGASNLNVTVTVTVPQPFKL